ncbi:MAG: iron ABC transporter permease [Pseudobacteriovorax sp.]|nr:iron ABC transporter permease [Pseudobacteriovorax sp.]
MLSKAIVTRLAPITMTLLLICALVLALQWGAAGSIGEMLFSDSSQLQLVFWQIRVPRILVAAICGSALGAAGVISQGFFRNELAGPSILGTTSGASAFVVLYMFIVGHPGHWLVVPVVAFLGAIVSTSLVLIFSARHGVAIQSSRLLLGGLALNALFGAMSTFILSLSLKDYSLSQSIMYWLLGGISGKGWHHIWLGLPLLLMGLTFGFRLTKTLNVLNLGEEVASTLSVSLPRLKWKSILIMALLVGTSVAVCGGIGFVGLVIPHLTRLLCGAEQSRLLVLSGLNGATLLIFADTLARNVLLPTELQVGALISMIGAPCFILLLYLRQRG